MLGATEPGPGISTTQAMFMELILTVGLVSTILGTASGAQNELAQERPQEETSQRRAEQLATM
jgi:glycerol uptake facilitator-like aquaporin